MNKDWKDKRAVWRTNNLMEENSRRNSLPQSRISSIKDLLQPRSRSRKEENINLDYSTRNGKYQ